MPPEKTRAISSSVDKLDKSPWEDVRKEMVEEKHLSPDVADRIWSYVQRKGGSDILDTLSSDDALKDNPTMQKGLAGTSRAFIAILEFRTTTGKSPHGLTMAVRPTSHVPFTSRINADSDFCYRHVPSLHLPPRLQYPPLDRIQPLSRPR